MEYLLRSNTGSDEVVANMRRFLADAPQEMRGFYESIITKTARIGCDAKSVNKAFGEEFIPQWDVQQSYSIEKTPLKKGEWFSLSEKLNGVRGTYFEGAILSRQGKEFSGLGHIIDDLSALFADLDGWVVDGELVRRNDDGLTDNENFRIGTGIIGQDDCDKSCIQMIVFDFLPKPEFIAGASKLTYKTRLHALGELREKVAGLGLASVSVVASLYSGTDAAMIDVFLDQMVREDKEGLMRNRDSKYYRKRHNGILKVKRFHTVDLRVVSVEEGTGRLSGKLGAFIVDYKGNTLNVGSGMTDEQREQFWQDRETLPGRVIEVKYKEESSDKRTGLCSLQFPIFLLLREEGKDVSYD
jgi:DNA ligase-1